MIDLDWDSFFRRGCMVFNSPRLFTHLETPLSRSKWAHIPFSKTDANYRIPLNRLSYRKPLKNTSDLIFEECFSDVASEKKPDYSHVWNGTDTGSCEWHNDHIEGSNVSVLMYYSDMKENSGGELMMRRTSDRVITEVHRPRKYDVVIFSQELNWQHRVGNLLDRNTDRITINFGFTIPELSYGFDN